GFACTTGVGGSAVLALLNDYCAKVLVGEDPLPVEELRSLLNSHLHRCGRGGTNTLALASLDTALWDIVGRHRGVRPDFVKLAPYEATPEQRRSLDLRTAKAA